ncbi:MAG: helix-turn-helix transcriptional regulator [Clostridium sp.]|nr:MAG: helix-turn-helix transcriptional regulator [Clostridium sp.]
MKELKIADNIRFFSEKANNLTQEELSKQLGGSKNLVSNYENGISTPDIYTLVKLADIFDITLDELVGRE